MYLLLPNFLFQGGGISPILNDKCVMEYSFPKEYSSSESIIGPSSSDTQVFEYCHWSIP